MVNMYAHIHTYIHVHTQQKCHMQQYTHTRTLQEVLTSISQTPHGSTLPAVIPSMLLGTTPNAFAGTRHSCVFRNQARVFVS